MTGRIFTIASLALLACAAPAAARSTIDTVDLNGGGGRELPPYLECVPYARQLTGIQIYGDAYTWWGQAEGRYARGRTPRVGAVMAFAPYANSRLGHVAAVSKVLDSRTVLIRHANWSVRGQIEDNVRAVDVSPLNDWSEVRVWYAPTQDLGTTHWPVRGFIYSDKAAPSDRMAAITPRAAPGSTPATRRRSSDPVGDIIAASLR